MVNTGVFQFHNFGNSSSKSNWILLIPSPASVSVCFFCVYRNLKDFLETSKSQKCKTLVQVWKYFFILHFYHSCKRNIWVTSGLKIEAVVQRCSVKKGVIRNFAKFTWKHLCQSFFFNKVAGLGNTFFTEHLWWLLLLRSNYTKFVLCKA